MDTRFPRSKHGGPVPCFLIDHKTLYFLTFFTWGAFTYDVRCFLGIFDLPTYPNQILYYISLFSKIRSLMQFDIPT